MLPPRVDCCPRVCDLPRIAWFVALVLWLAASACIGGQTGDGSGAEETGEDELGDIFAQCSDQAAESVTRLDEELPELGFSPQQMLEWVADGVDSSLLWAPDGGVQTQPESGTGSVQLTFEYKGGEILLYQPVSADTQAEGLPVADCPAFLAIEVQATLRTPGGALDETFGVWLTAYVPEVSALRAS